jgi:hypothetical protein
MPLTLLNLLIAILSESYANMQVIIKKKQSSTLNEIISELELYKPLNSDDDAPTYLVFAEYEDALKKDKTNEPSPQEL